MNDGIMIVKNPFLLHEIQKNGCKALALYKNYSNILMRFGHLTESLSLLKLFNLNPLLKKIEEDTIIIFDGGTRINTLKWFSQKYRKKRLIFYYWNPVALSINPSQIPGPFEKWSYSPYDCEKYGLKFNSTFYFSEFAKDVKLVGKKNDVFFLGLGKKRTNDLFSYEQIFQQMNLVTEFIIVEKNGKKYPYSEILEKDLQSKCLFDYYTDSQAGLSLRAMESLFLEKKLITNNTSIVKYDFFNTNNIFVLGQQNLDELSSFVETPYEKIPETIKEKYTFNSWLKKFKNN